MRPPLVAREPASTAVAVWRFRVIATVLLLALAALVVALFLKFSGVTAEDPGLGLPGARLIVSVAVSVTASAAP